MTPRSIHSIYKRYRTLHTHVISELPVLILMPHSACNCRCVMCDIWKDNKNLKQLTAADISSLLAALRKFGTQRVVMSGGEALLNPHFFSLCELLKQQKIKISLLTTGLSVRKHASQLLRWVDDLIVSLDGDEALHDAIRNIPGAFRKLKEGVSYLKGIHPGYKITGRTVIHQLNFRSWHAIIDAAAEMGLDQISFLPADVSSHAFNRQMTWTEPRQHEILIPAQQLPELRQTIEDLTSNHMKQFNSRFIAESVNRIQDIYHYYAAFYGINPFPYKKCNAPWVSTVIEADGIVRPCFFHEKIGNIRDASLDQILNGKEGIGFRKHLDMATNDTCRKCVCSLNLSPLTQLT